MEPKADQFPDITKQIAEVAYLNNWHRTPAALRFLPEMLSQFYRFLFDLVHGFKVTAMSVGRSETAAAIIEVAVVTILFLLAFVIVYIVRPKIAARKASLGYSDLDSGIKMVESAKVLQKKAEQLANNADFDGAIKCLYLSALRALHEQAIVSYLPVATNFEYCNLLADYADLKRAFRVIADKEEQVSFGQVKASKLDFDQCLLITQALDEHLHELVEKKRANENRFYEEL